MLSCARYIADSFEAAPPSAAPRPLRAAIGDEALACVRPRDYMSALGSKLVAWITVTDFVSRCPSVTPARSFQRFACCACLLWTTCSGRVYIRKLTAAHLAQVSAYRFNSDTRPFVSARSQISFGSQLVAWTTVSRFAAQSWVVLLWRLRVRLDGLLSARFYIGGALAEECRSGILRPHVLLRHMHAIRTSWRPIQERGNLSSPLPSRAS